MVWTSCILRFWRYFYFLPFFIFRTTEDDVLSFLKLLRPRKVPGLDWQSLLGQGLSWNVSGAGLYTGETGI